MTRQARGRQSKKVIDTTSKKPETRRSAKKVRATPTASRIETRASARKVYEELMAQIDECVEASK